MTNCLRILGGVPLRGEVTLSGSKNGVLPILAASLLVDGTVTLRNVPQISDVDKMCQLMRLLGAVVTQDGETVTINAARLTTYRADRDLAAAMRASHYVLAPLLARADWLNFECHGIDLTDHDADGVPDRLRTQPDQRVPLARKWPRFVHLVEDLARTHDVWTLAQWAEAGV